MYYAGRDNKVYRKYAQYRNWLYAIDDAVMVAIGVSLFSLVSTYSMNTWYAEGVSFYEAAMWIIVGEVI